MLDFVNKSISKFGERLNLAIAEQRGVELVHDFGEVGRTPLDKGYQTVALRVFRQDGYWLPQFIVTTHFPNRLPSNSGGCTTFTSVEEMVHFFSSIPSDPAKVIDERPYDPAIDKMPWLDRVFGRFVAGAHDYRCIAERKVEGSSYQNCFSVYVYRMRKKKYGDYGINLRFTHRVRMKHEGVTVAIPIDFFQKCVKLLAESKFQVTEGGSPG